MNSNNKLVNKLNKKINDEYKNFIKEIEKLSPKEIIEKSHEITIKQEITNLYLESYDDKILKCLIKEKNLIDKIYKDYINNNDGIYNTIEENA